MKTNTSIYTNTKQKGIRCKAVSSSLSVIAVLLHGVGDESILHFFLNRKLSIAKKN